MFNTHTFCKTVTLLLLTSAIFMQNTVFAISNQKEKNLNRLKSPGPRVSYLEARKKFNKSDLVELNQLIDESRENLSLIGVLQTIAFVSERGDKDAVKTLINSFNRNDSDLLKNQKLLKGRPRKSLAWRITIDKAYILESIGIIGGQEATTFLMNILATNKLDKLAGEWLDYSEGFSGDQEKILSLLRGRAATGLVFSQNKDAIASVKKLYNREHENYRRTGIKSSLFTNLVDAMAYSDLIDEIGLENVLEMHGYDGGNTLFSYLGKYLSKYLYLESPIIENDLHIATLDNFNNLPVRMPLHKMTQKHNSLYNQARGGSMAACTQICNASDSPAELTRWAYLQMIKQHAISNQITDAVAVAEGWIHYNSSDPYALKVKAILAELLSKRVGNQDSSEYMKFQQVCEDIFTKYELSNMPVIQTHVLMAQVLKRIDTTGLQDNAISQHLNLAVEGTNNLLEILRAKTKINDETKRVVIEKYQVERDEIEAYLQRIRSLP